MPGRIMTVINTGNCCIVIYGLFDFFIIFIRKAKIGIKHGLSVGSIKIFFNQLLSKGLERILI